MNYNMVAFYVGDYLAGAVRVRGNGSAWDSHGAGDPWYPGYWPLEWREGDDWELVELLHVPEDIALKLENQGSLDQWYADGYEAANAAAPFVRKA